MPPPTPAAPAPGKRSAAPRLRYPQHLTPDKEYTDRVLAVFEQEVGALTAGTLMSGSLAFQLFRRRGLRGFTAAFVGMLSIIAALAAASPAMEMLPFLFRAACGALLAQFIFAYSHMLVHAFMLEYNLWLGEGGGVVPNWVFMKAFPTLSWYAFYHHHHTPGCDWGKGVLSPLYDHHCTSVPKHERTRDGPLGAQGYLNMVVAHWTSYSMALGKPTALLYVAGGALLPQLLPAFAGYELGMLICPFNHLHGHSGNRDDSGTVRSLFMNAVDCCYIALDRTGLIASVQDHKIHHDHTHRNVFASFTSSGLYSKLLDRFFDVQWNWCCDKAAAGNMVQPGEDTASDTARRQNKLDAANPYRLKPYLPPPHRLRRHPKAPEPINCIFNADQLPTGYLEMMS